ncbi:MAG TPA: hypothetical protein DCX01_01050 [Bacteroidetes bacterium]|nr:hypothetical protein [Bacteroidota bacterium]
METIFIACVSIALFCSVFSIVLTLILKNELGRTNNEILECATRTHLLKLEISTLETKLNPPKKRRGRPRKNVQPKVVHSLGEL